MTVFNHLTVHKLVRHYERIDKPSLTEVDFYEDLKDMIPRICRGEVSPCNKKVYYELKAGQESDEDFDREDYSDGIRDFTEIDEAQEVLSAFRFSKETKSDENKGKDAPARNETQTDPKDTSASSTT